LNYQFEDTTNYLQVDDYDYGIDKVEDIRLKDVDSTLESTLEISDVPEVLISEISDVPEPEVLISEISGVEEVHVPRLYTATIDRHTDSEYHILSTPAYGYLREDIEVNEIGLKCVQGELKTIANISYIQDDNIV